MVDWHAIVGIVIVALGLVVTPGPNMIYLVSRSITQGRRAGLLSLAGVVVGFLVYLVPVAVSLAAVLALVPMLYLTIKVAGAAYLLYLAWRALRPGGEQTLVLGLCQITVALTVNCVIMLSASKISRFLGRRPTRLRVQRYLMGTVLAGLAVRIATDPR